MGGDGGLIVGQRSCATEQGRPSELEWEDESESKGERNGILVPAPTPAWNLHATINCAHTQSPLLPSRRVEALEQIEGDHPHGCCKFICFTDILQSEPPSDYSHSNAETVQSGNLCETGRPVISQAEPES